MRFKAIIVDDEPKSRINLKTLLEEYCAEVDVIGDAGTISDAVNVLKDNNPDILFLDIEMQGHSGFDILAKFPTRTFDVVFVTAYNEYALKALKEQAIDYLLKPIDPTELVKAVVKLSDKRWYLNANIGTGMESVFSPALPKAQKLQVPFEKGIRFIDLNTIIRIKANNNYSELVLTTGEKITCSLTLGRLQEQLPETQFIRVHQSHLVNIQFVSKYYRTNGGQLEMTDGSSIEISRRKKDELLRVLRSS